MVSGEGPVQKTGASWRKGVVRSWKIDGNMWLDAESVDIPGVVMENPGVVIDWSCHSFHVSPKCDSSQRPGIGWFSLFQCIAAGDVVEKHLHVRISRYNVRLFSGMSPMLSISCLNLGAIYFIFSFVL